MPKYKDLRMDQKAYLIALGGKIKSLRKDLGLSQEEFAEQLGVNRGTIIRIENGTQNSTIQMLLSISEVLRVEIKDLVAI